MKKKKQTLPGKPWKFTQLEIPFPDPARSKPKRAPARKKKRTWSDRKKEFLISALALFLAWCIREDYYGERKFTR